MDQYVDLSIDTSTRKSIQGNINSGNYFKAADDLEGIIGSDIFYYSLVSACNESKLINEGIPEDAAVRWLPKVFNHPRIFTTNYDSVLEIAFAQERKYLRVCTPSDSRMFLQFMPRHLYKIHGSYDSNYEDVVLTSRSYGEKYKKDGLLYNNFKHIVQSSSLFFLGASLKADKTLDILKESAKELTVGGHYCGNMHYAIVSLSTEKDRFQRVRELAEYKILPILYSKDDCSNVENKHSIVSIILERLYNEVVIPKRNNKAMETVEQYKQRANSTAEGNYSNLRSNVIDTSSPRYVDGSSVSQQIKENPLKAFRLALRQNDLSFAESMLRTLEHALPREVFLIQVLAPLASRGSTKAAEILFGCVDELQGFSSSQLIDVAGSLVSYCSRLDKEEYFDRVKVLLEKAKETASAEELGSIYNQYSRLYYGIYTHDETKEESKKNAESYIRKAIELNSSEPSYYYNLAMILKEKDLYSAKEAIDECLYYNTKDLDHLELALKLYRETNDPRAEQILERIRIINPLWADLLSS